MLPQLFWPTVRKNCSSVWGQPLKFKAEGREFVKILRSLEQLVQTVKSQNNFTESPEGRSYVWRHQKTCSACVKQALNTRHWLVNALVTWHVSYKITTLTECFLNLFLEVSQIQSIRTTRIQIGKKVLGFRNRQENRKYCDSVWKCVHAEQFFISSWHIPLFTAFSQQSHRNPLLTYIICIY